MKSERLPPVETADRNGMSFPKAIFHPYSRAAISGCHRREASSMGMEAYDQERVELVTGIR